MSGEAGLSTAGWPDPRGYLWDRLQVEFDRVRTVGSDSESAAPGLYIPEEEVTNTLRAGAAEARWPLDAERLDLLARHYALTAFEVDVLVACLAPDLDPSFERIYGFLQDALSRTRPAVGLLLRLFCPDPTGEARARGSFRPTSPLFAGELLRLPEGADAPLLAQAPRADERVVGHLIGDDSVDGRLLAYLRLEQEPRPRLLPASAVDQALAVVARGAGDLIALVAPPAGGQAECARLMAREIHRPLLLVDVPALLRCQACSPPQAVRLVIREARLLGAVTCWSRASVLWQESEPVNAAALATLESQLRSWPGLSILADDAGWEPPPTLAGRVLIRLSLPGPGRQEREQAWRGALEAYGIQPAGLEDELSSLARTFRLTVEQISEAVLVASRRSALEGRDTPGTEHLRAGARAVSGRRLTELGHEIRPRARWDHLVLPPDSLEQLWELCTTVRTRSRVLEDWGFGDRLTGGRGVTALFAGISGTGKTMAAEVVANELSLPLFRIELAGIVSKWIGETEKNLDRVFDAAADSNAILFFDEADALFGKRSEVKDSHDRYANLEISYLLQKMESYDGAAILATNMRQQLDDAFLRRLTFTMIFPLPESEDRLRIWEAVWPPELPRGLDVDLAALSRLKLTGGNIKNVVLAAAHFAAAETRVVGMDDLTHALRREYQKLGKQMTIAEIEASIR
ncbi:ATP-binding protein [Candidatus Nephthysia bennettiae]|uniref:ATP-binding protein n=1 Tax=Candidatus Nephthysia bennettiae TaxID=3127016 RepID=A0A934K9Z3_9BACT|nr:ATP-binding protein [Candidatus Dormibacteraeota bacterium]MBJ7614333.1 ATP-binding protein [Candidatus Dormibacteraeota bacterium]